MKIVPYDDLDPFDVLDLNVLCFNFALTPDMVTRIRRYDRRPFPFFALYAVEHSQVIGQVGVFRIPLMTVEGLLKLVEFGPCVSTRPSCGKVLAPG